MTPMRRKPIILINNWNAVLLNVNYVLLMESTGHGLAREGSVTIEGI